jgi:hypothetical protein
VLHDLRYALRWLRLNPAITSLVVLSLAIGIGSTTAVFGLIDAVVLTALPGPTPDRLVTATLILPQGTFDNFTYAQFEEFRKTPVLRSACAWSADRFDVRWAGHSASVPGQYVTR